jgi:hypothetical protein
MAKPYLSRIRSANSSATSVAVVSSPKFLNVAIIDVYKLLNVEKV